METNDMMKSLSENQNVSNGFFADDSPIEISVLQYVQYEEHIEEGFVY